MEIASRLNLYHYNRNLQPLANQLRKSMTKAEAIMWKYLLSKRQMRGYQFRRQRPVLNYIADFMCMDLLLIIEVDGISHIMKGVHKTDDERDQDLRSIGFTVLRFSNQSILSNLSEVDEIVTEWILDNEKRCFNQY